MLPSPQGATQSPVCTEVSDGAWQTELQHLSEQNMSKEQQHHQGLDPSSPSVHDTVILPSDSKRLKIKRDKTKMKEKKKRAHSTSADKAGFENQSEIAALAEQLEHVQLQSIPTNENNKIVPPILNHEEEKILGNNFVNVLEFISPKHPTAIFQCVICKKFCKSYGMVVGHVNDPLHKQKLQRMKDDMTLNCLPSPTRDQIVHVTRVVNNVHTARALGKKGLKDRKAVAFLVNSLAKELHPDCGVRIYGSTATGLALRTSDLNMELIVTDESMASKMFCRLADEMEKDQELYRDLERHFTDSEPALTFYVKDHNFKCVIIMQNKHSYLLSQLISDYIGLDQRVRILGIMLRALAMDIGLDKPDMGFWPPHAFALLMIYFLQQLKDPVLPVLHEMVDNCDYSREVYCDVKDLAEKWHTSNDMSVGELWLKFLRFYTVEFAIQEYVVCIRQKAPLTRASKNWTGKKIAIEDPFRPKVNVSRSLEIFTCFEFAMNCLKKAYKYFGILQLPNDPLVVWIYDSSKFRCTFQPVLANRTTIENYAKWVSLPNGDPQQSAEFHCLGVPVTKEDAEVLFEIFNSKYLHYKYDPSKFLGKEGRPIRCTTCGNVGHSANKCKVEKLLPVPENLPPMEDYYMDAVMKCCTEIEERWSMQPDEVEKRKQIVTDVENFVCQKKPNAMLELFGSSCNGFGLQKSDIDICMTFKDNEKGEGIEFVNAIEELTQLLKSYNKMKNILAITTAKVPIVKFYLPESDLEGDISMYNVLALRNTQLLKTYAAIDPRVKTLGCVVKRFAKACDICDASRGSLSSYAYILMLIFFLQRCDPPVLPVLQEFCKPEDSQFMVDEFDTYFYSDLSQLESTWVHFGQNKASVSGLWLDFLKFYSKFNFNVHVISIRQIKPLLCFEKRWTNKVMAIEDPFEITHNLGARLSRKMLVYIINTFRTAYTLFGTPRISCLDFFGKLEKYFLDPRQLTSGEPPNDRGCRLCKKTDHMIKQCPLRKQNRFKNMQKRGNGAGMDRRQALPRNEPALARNVNQQPRKPPVLPRGFLPHQPASSFQGSYKQLLFMNSDLTRNAQNLRYNKIPVARSNRSNQQPTNSIQEVPLSSRKLHLNVNHTTAGSSSAQSGDSGFGADRDTCVFPRKATDFIMKRATDFSMKGHQQNLVNSTSQPLRFQFNSGVSMPGPSSVSQNSVFSFSAEAKSPGPSTRLLNGTTSPVEYTVFKLPPPRPSTHCFYGPPQTPPVVDVGVDYKKKK